ncbi:hypothetical protein [Bacteroides acidifaciens]|nr:hypothetical protein [Bacteroides acidifaciens]
MREGKEVHIKGIGYYEVSRDVGNPRDEGCEGREGNDIMQRIT